MEHTLNMFDDAIADRADAPPSRRPISLPPSASKQGRPSPFPQPRKGRGAVGNPTGRYEPEQKVPFDDGWCDADDADFAPEVLRTTVVDEKPKSVITRNQSPDLGFDRSVNPYRGCEHGCIYCFARPTHARMNLSPGLDFESKLFAKPDAAALLKNELAKPGYQCRPIAMGTNTDPYQPVERQRRITRSILKVLSDAGHPVSIVTKSALVERDLDILAPMAEQGLVKVCLSVTTLERRLARRMEPRAATPARRLATLRSLRDAGIPCGVMVAPVVPALTDDEFEPILQAAAEAGADSAGYILLRLPLEVKDLFGDWLETHYPDRAKRVMNRVREMRGGKLNDAEFGSRLVGDGPFARLLERRFVVATRKLGLIRDHGRLRTDRFVAPQPSSGQLKLI